jgi:hypothetical protein
MPLIAADFVHRLSGGAANSTPSLSIGGAKSSTAASTALNGLFPLITSAQAAAGVTLYRCLYMHNANASSLMVGARIWLSANTPNTSTIIDIGIGASGVNGTETATANETTAPAGVSFSAPATSAAGLALGDIPAGQHRAFWVRLTVTAGAAFSASDAVAIDATADYTS